MKIYPYLTNKELQKIVKSNETHILIIEILLIAVIVFGCYFNYKIKQELKEVKENYIELEKPVKTFKNEISIDTSSHTLLFNLKEDVQLIEGKISNKGWYITNGDTVGWYINREGHLLQGLYKPTQPTVIKHIDSGYITTFGIIKDINPLNKEK